MAQKHDKPCHTQHGNREANPEDALWKTVPLQLENKKWHRKHGIATLHNDGTISGIASDNETFWLIDDEGQLVFKHRDGRISSIFTHANQRDGKWYFSGPFQFKPGVEHLLEEVR